MRVKVPKIPVTILSAEGPTGNLWITRPPWVSRDWIRLMDWGADAGYQPTSLVAGVFSNGWVLLFLHLPGRSLWEERTVRHILPPIPPQVRTLRRILPAMMDRVIERGIGSPGYRAWLRGTGRSRS